MKWYAVMQIQKRVEISESGVCGSLPDGEGFIPCFSDYDKAKEFADGSDILEFTTVDKKKSEEV